MRPCAGSVSSRMCASNACGTSPPKACRLWESSTIMCDDDEDDKEEERDRSRACVCMWVLLVLLSSSKGTREDWQGKRGL